MVNSHLPEEVIEEILSLLPVKSLLRFKCVSKSWRSLIDSEGFIKTHLKNSRESKTLSHRMLVSRAREDGKMNSCSLHSLMNDPIPRPSPFGYIPSDFPAEGRILGCCNGIVCIVHVGKNDGFCMWNPSTRTLIHLPLISPDNPNVCPWLCSFGWDESSGAYKVFANANTPRARHRGEIYSSDRNTWTTVAMDVRDMIEPGTFFHGKFHFIRVLKDLVFEIIGLDLKSQDRVGVIANPCNGKGSLRVLKGCLSMVHFSGREKHLDVWIMKEYGVNDSWMKLMNLDFSCVDFRSMSEWEILASMFILEVGLNGEILMTYEDSYLVYDPEEKAILKFKRVKGLRYRAHLFFESLVCPVLKPKT